VINSPIRISRFLSLAEFADLVGVSRKTVTRWIKAGDLRAHRLGRQIRISEEDAVTFTAVRRR
jgi:excisionase family DNA binding protein